MFSRLTLRVTGDVDQARRVAKHGLDAQFNRRPDSQTTGDIKDISKGKRKRRSLSQEERLLTLSYTKEALLSCCSPATSSSINYPERGEEQ